MTAGPTADPFSFFREALTQWEKSANEIGTKVLGTEKAVEMMHKSTTASLQMQNAMKDGMNKALAVANMPSKADIDALSAQIGTLEGRLARIEDLLSGTGATATPKPKRTRTPPEKS